MPAELKDTFRLLTRFGTRLRARHGQGTKHHIKFDDFNGSMFSNIKLPGDSVWTRVTPEMARRDLEASMSEENSANQKRLDANLIPGPRDRLSRPLPVIASGPPRATGVTSRPLSGQRPRWSAGCIVPEVAVLARLPPTSIALTHGVVHDPDTRPAQAETDVRRSEFWREIVLHKNGAAH